MFVASDVFQYILCDTPQETHFSEETILLWIVCGEDCENYV